MRIAVLLLLLANVSFFVYALIDGRAAGETSQQVQPDKIKLLTPQQVAALDKTSALPDVCVEWGPFTDADRTRALGDLDPLGLGRLLTQRRVDNAKGGAANLLVIRDPSSAVVTRLRELAPVYPAADVKVTACDSR